MKKLFLIIIWFMISNSSVTFSQLNNFDCAYISNSTQASGYIFGGTIKPNRTDSSGGVALPSDAYFPVLVVFVQFKGEQSDPRNTLMQDSAPVYINKIIARDKNSSGDWWNYYNNQTQILSSHWSEISRGKFHVISPTPSGVNTAFSVVLPFPASHYDSLGIPGGELKINEDIWKSIRLQGLTDWRKFDRWKYNTTTGYFEFKDLGQADGFVDMIYKVHKSRGVGGLVDYAGYNVLSYHAPGTTPFLIDTANNIKINYGNSFEGSGVTVSFRGQLSQYLGTMGHEHGHQLFSSGHSTYSRVNRGYGFDYFYSPADMILNGYMSTKNISFNSNNVLGDYSSRNTGGGEIFKIPIQGNEYFMIANRNKISRWDRIMIGDSSQIGTYDDTTDYGKGLYIYHVPDGINFPGGDISQQDMECADGVFQWEYAGQSAQQVVHDCFISGANDWPYYKKTSVIYDNDITIMENHFGKGDGLSFNNYIFADTTFDVKWWGEGEQPANNCNIGTDRIFTNKNEIYTSFEMGGDRWDAWRPGYNEIFSPYSSPSTNTWNTSPTNQNSGIFIWYHSFNSSTKEASIKVYKVGLGEPLSEDSVLRLTPPSRPMGLRVLACDSLPTINGYKRIKIRWNHNMEPDMENLVQGNQSYTKEYKIYRSKGDDMNSIPNDAMYFPEQFYECIDTVFIDETAIAEYTDTELISVCNKGVCTPPNFCILYPVRYRVQAVDKYNSLSVLSDFAKTEAWSINASIGEDNFQIINTSENNSIPKEYALKQNYPNPFNPTTNIQYDLPSDNFVTLKIYDILGKEIMTLVNEFKNAGSYILSFNASNLSSGIYYYKLKSGDVEMIRKMVVIK